MREHYSVNICKRLINDSFNSHHWQLLFYINESLVKLILITLNKEPLIIKVFIFIFIYYIERQYFLN